jgi:hypothetical protein
LPASHGVEQRTNAGSLGLSFKNYPARCGQSPDSNQDAAQQLGGRVYPGDWSGLEVSCGLVSFPLSMERRRQARIRQTKTLQY